MRVDLHMHSTASDGQYAPTELVRLAKTASLEVMALTDHDTMSGLREALAAGSACGLRVISGVELSAAEFDNLHILGYGFPPDSLELNRLCAWAAQERERHMDCIADFLWQKGVPVNLDEVRTLAGNGSIGRPHFAQVMVRHGYVKNSREAFDRYLDTEEYNNRVKRKKPSAQVCIETIRAAGGWPVLAHPYQLRLEDAALEELLRRLLSYGLAGIECYYPKHTPEQRAFYLRLAEKYHLHVTAGSDFHGERVHSEDRILPARLDVSWLLSDKERVQEA